MQKRHKMSLDLGAYEIVNNSRKEKMKPKRSLWYNGALENRRKIKGRDKGK